MPGTEDWRGFGTVVPGGRLTVPRLPVGTTGGGLVGVPEDDGVEVVVLG
jgi:hypothetical protein